MIKACLTCNKLFEGRGNSKYCSIYCGGKADHAKRQLSPKSRFSKLAAMAKNRAKSKSLDYNIDGAFLLDLYEGQEQCCALTGRLLELAPSDEFIVHPNAPSVDRIIPSEGYTKGNVRLITYQCNMALGEYGDEHLYSLCQDILENGVSFK